MGLPGRNAELRFVARVLDEYVNHTGERMMQTDAELSKLEETCEKLRQRNRMAETFARQFFEERKRVADCAMRALDVAIAQRDARVADIAMNILDDEYNRDVIETIRKF